jgi:hypothetical protein
MSSPAAAPDPKSIDLSKIEGSDQKYVLVPYHHTAEELARQQPSAWIQISMGSLARCGRAINSRGQI